MSQQTNSIHHVYKLMYGRTKVQKSHSMPLKNSRRDWTHELQPTILRKKKLAPKTVTLENNFPFQHLAIAATSSAGTHQLKVSFSVLWGASESSTQHPVLWLIPTAPEEGNQAIRKGKNTIFFTFLHFLTCDLKYISIPTYIWIKYIFSINTWLKKVLITFFSSPFQEYQKV